MNTLAHQTRFTTPGGKSTRSKAKVSAVPNHLLAEHMSSNRTPMSPASVVLPTTDLQQGSETDQIQRQQDDEDFWDVLSPGNIAGVVGLANDVAQSSSGLSTGLGGVASGVGLVTGLMDLFGEDKSAGERTLGGMSAAGGAAGLVGTASSALGSGSLAVGGATGLSATMGAATSAGGAGLASMGAAGLATSAGAVLGAGAAGYGAGRILDEGTNLGLNALGIGGWLDEMEGVSRPGGQSRDVSISGLGADVMTEADRAVSSLWADPSRPAYTQTLGWKLGEWLGI